MFSGKGSGGWLKKPESSQDNSTTLQPRAWSNIGAIEEAAPLLQSRTTFGCFSLILFLFMYVSFSIFSTCFWIHRSSTLILPSLSHDLQPSRELLAMRNSFRTCAADRKMPSGPMNLSPFHWMGLWLAVITRPWALESSAAISTVGVGQIPRSNTSHPEARRPEITADLSISPEGLESLPSTTLLPLQKSPKARAYLSAASGVSPSPTIPLRPDMETNRLFIRKRIPWDVYWLVSFIALC